MKKLSPIPALIEVQEEDRYLSYLKGTSFYDFKCDVGHEFTVVMDVSYKVDPKVPCPVFDCFEDTELQTPENCEHEFEGYRQPGTPHGPPEYFLICKKCGAEKQD